MLSEFDFIQRYCQGLGADDSQVTQSVGDDAAVIRFAGGEDLLVATDTMNLNSHFFASDDPASLAHKLVHVNLSDIAAMGGTPRWATVSVAVPELDMNWVEAFSSGLDHAANEANIAIVGGDTTTGAWSLSMTIIGTVPAGTALLRSGAQAGDYLVVTGQLGGAAYGLNIARQLFSTDSDDISISKTLSAHESKALERLRWPNARLDISSLIHGYASSCMDISDGLLGDVRHICAASKMDVEIDLGLIPIDSALRQNSELERSAQLRFALTGGEDYELLFTISPAAWKDWCDVHPDYTGEVTRIGTINSRPVGSNGMQLSLLGEHSEEVASWNGYQHFSNQR